MRGELRDEMHGTLRRSRRHLFAATVVLLAIGILVATAVVWTITNTREGGYYVLRTDDVNVIAGFDLTIALLIGLVVVLLGQAMTKYDLYGQKALPRRELARRRGRATRWLRATACCWAARWCGGWSRSTRVLLTAGLMTVFFVLLSWRASGVVAGHAPAAADGDQPGVVQAADREPGGKAGAPGGPAN